MADPMDAILERTQWDLFWLPGDVRAVDRPELLYTACPRDAAGMNRVLRVRAGPERVGALVAEVLAAHAGRRSCWQLSPGSDSPALRAALEAAGYAPGEVHDGYSLSTADRGLPPARGIAARPVRDMAGLLDAIAVTERAFGQDLMLTEAILDGYLAGCTAPGARVHRVVAYDAETGEPLSTGGITAYPALRFGLLWGGGSAPEGRGRGAYAQVLAGRLAWARSRGLERVGMYARVNTAGPIAAAKGFTRHGPMTFWVRPAA